MLYISVYLKVPKEMHFFMFIGVAKLSFVLVKALRFSILDDSGAGLVTDARIQRDVCFFHWVGDKRLRADGYEND